MKRHQLGQTDVHRLLARMDQEEFQAKMRAVLDAVAADDSNDDSGERKEQAGGRRASRGGAKATADSDGSGQPPAAVLSPASAASAAAAAVPTPDGTTPGDSTPPRGILKRSASADVQAGGGGRRKRERASASGSDPSDNEAFNFGGSTAQLHTPGSPRAGSSLLQRAKKYLRSAKAVAPAEEAKPASGTEAQVLAELTERADPRKVRRQVSRLQRQGSVQPLQFAAQTLGREEELAIAAQQERAILDAAAQGEMALRLVQQAATNVASVAAAEVPVAQTAPPPRGGGSVLLSARLAPPSEPVVPASTLRSMQRRRSSVRRLSTEGAGTACEGGGGGGAGRSGTLVVKPARRDELQPDSSVRRVRFA